MKLIIVESPTKSKTISGFLDSQFEVVSSNGHIRDLPKTQLGVNIDNGFEPKYVIPKRAKNIIKKLKEKVKKAKVVILATDEDREGESIAWHLVEVLNLNEKTKPYQRIVFHEITKESIKRALLNPRKINKNLVHAQQARRILDRLVGYKLSPFLWEKVAHRLSAGRVQSVALRLIVDREREIENFVPQEYWTIEAEFEKEKDKIFAILSKKNGKKILQFGIKTEKEAKEILKELKERDYKISNIEKKQIKRHPLPPFITSTLQQTAWQKFKFTAKFTMRIAQELYERGFITYHRTDSLNLSDEALKQAEKFILENYGKDYYCLRKFKTKSKLAQEAHEAIRPTDVQRTPEKVSKILDKNCKRIYELIWQRFIASQMSPALFFNTKVEIETLPKDNLSHYTFKSQGQILKFDGFLKVYPLSYEEKNLPALEIGEFLKLKKITPLQHFTQPPPRYNEASLIKELEKHGIGRPSTYAPILSIIQQRNYVKKDKNKRFFPTEIGKIVNDLLVKHFPNIVDIKFTALMEEDLDKIAKGQKDKENVLREFYEPFEENLKRKQKELSKEDIAIEKTNKKCPLCNSELVVRLGRFGKFLSCSNFPNCKYKASLNKKNKNK